MSEGQDKQTSIATLLSQAGAILFGVLLIAIVTPLSQFLTINFVSHDLEVASPIGWAVGIVFTIVLLYLPIKLIVSKQWLSRPNIVLIYIMLTIAVPVMNLGFVRQAFISMYAVSAEYLKGGTDTYHTAYTAANDAWYPKIPTRSGMGWYKSHWVLQQLDKTRQRQASLKADRYVNNQISLIAQRVTSAEAKGEVLPPIDPTVLKHVRTAAEVMGYDQLKGFNDLIGQAGKEAENKAIEKLGIAELFKAAFEKRELASSAASQRLQDHLSDVDPYALMNLPAYLNQSNRTVKKKLAKVASKLSEAQQLHYDKVHGKLISAVDPTDGQSMQLWEQLRADVTALNKSDYAKLQASLSSLYTTLLNEQDEATFDLYRSQFMLIMTKEQRMELGKLSLGNPQAGMPNQGVMGITEKMYHNARLEKEAESKPFFPQLGTDEEGNEIPSLLGDANEQIPWAIWRGPMIMWGTLALVIFLLLMCIAEWLRRKWIERENLAFPLVEVVDNFIRHDAKLETAIDPTIVEKRGFGISIVLVLGIALGALLISLDAMGHYGMIATDWGIQMNVSKDLLTTGALKEMKNVVFVLSPIIIGIAFLISLELSFSIWVTFFLYQFTVLAVSMSTKPIKDPYYAGWAGGKSYPFPMEQMLGAVALFAILLLVKSLRGSKTNTNLEDRASFVPKPVFYVGIIGLPIIAMALLWNLGITNIPFLILIGFIFLAQALVQARVRAESGMPTHHVSYEFTKLPLVFGLTGFLGANVFARFASVAFLPMTLLGRSLSQHLENIELARRHKINYRTVAIASVIAFVVAIVIGMTSWLHMSYIFGEEFFAASKDVNQGVNSFSIGRYSLWVSHFLGEQGLDKWGGARSVRIAFIFVGVAVFGLLTFLRGRFLKFPIHPMGYLILLLSIYYSWISPYYKEAQGEASLLWGGVFIAWLIKKLTIKYGGMNAYKQAKPFFIGLVVGSVVAVFAWNMVDLGCSIYAYSLEGGSAEKLNAYVDYFVKNPPYSPRFY